MVILLTLLTRLLKDFDDSNSTPYPVAEHHFYSAFINYLYSNDLCFLSATILPKASLVKVTTQTYYNHSSHHGNQTKPVLICFTKFSWIKYLYSPVYGHLGLCSVSAISLRFKGAETYFVKLILGEFKKIFYIDFLRERKGEVEKRRNSKRQSAVSCMPNTRDWGSIELKTWVRALLGTEPTTFQCLGWCPNNWASPARYYFLS